MTTYYEVGAAPRNSAAAHKYEDWWKMDAIVSKHQDRDHRLATILVNSDQTDSQATLERFKKADIDFSDMSGMELEDFTALGFTTHETETLMRSFKVLPTQNVSFKEICQIPAAKNYNEHIFNEAYKNLNDSHIALIETCINIRKDPPADMILGEKNFASKFLVETLNELHGAAQKLRKELDEFALQETKDKELPEKRCPLRMLQSGAAALGLTLVALFLWKRFT